MIARDWTARARSMARYPSLWDSSLLLATLGPQSGGASARDFSGRGNHGALIGGPQWGMDTRRGGPFRAMDFDGVNHYVDFGNKAAFHPPSVSVSVWLKTTDPYPPDKVHSAFAAKWSGRGWIFWVNYDDVKLGDSNSSRLVWAGGKSAISDGVWHNLVGTISDGVGRMFLDGDLVASGGNFDRTLTAAPLCLGAYASGGHGRYNGQLAAARIYSRALSAGEIRILARHPDEAYRLRDSRVFAMPRVAFWAWQPSRTIGGGII